MCLFMPVMVVCLAKDGWLQVECITGMTTNVIYFTDADVPVGA